MKFSSGKAGAAILILALSGGVTAIAQTNADNGPGASSNTAQRNDTREDKKDWGWLGLLGLVGLAGLRRRDNDGRTGNSRPTMAGR